MATDAGGNLYIADYQNIRKVTPDGGFATVAGKAVIPDSGDGGPAAFAQLGAAAGLAMDATGNLFISSVNRIRRVGTDGMIVTVAGNGEGRYSGDTGPAINATFEHTGAMAFDRAGNLYIAEIARIRKVDPNGTITTVAGNGVIGYSGDGGRATAAQIAYPQGLTCDAAGNLYIADSSNWRIRKVNTAGIITTFAGTGTGGFSGDGGPAVNANINYPNGLAVDAAGNLYIADTLNCRVRKVATDGVISTIGGDCFGDYKGDGIPAVHADLGYFYALAVDATGIYVADRYYRVRKITTDGMITTIVGKNGFPGYAGDGGPALAGGVYQPLAIAPGLGGKLYIADQYPNVVRQLTPAGGSPVLSISKTHAANFTPGQTGAAYSLVVSNSPGAGPTSGAVIVQDIVPAGLTLLNMSGQDWNCASSTCTRSSTLNPGESYPPITATFNVAPDAPLQVVNEVTVSGAGSTPTGITDATNISGLTNPILLSPSNATSTTASSVTLTWSASAGATSYDVYFGSSSTPPMLANTSATTYTPANLTLDTTYFWRIVAKSGLRSAGSATWSFAALNIRYRLTTVASPANGGVIYTNLTTSDGYYISGTSLQITAAPSFRLSVQYWSGDLYGNSNPLHRHGWSPLGHRRLHRSPDFTGPSQFVPVNPLPRCGHAQCQWAVWRTRHHRPDLARFRHPEQRLRHPRHGGGILHQCDGRAARTTRIPHRISQRPASSAGFHAELD